MSEYPYPTSALVRTKASSEARTVVTCLNNGSNIEFVCDNIEFQCYDIEFEYLDDD